MKMIRFKAQRQIWKWFAAFGLSFALASQAIGAAPYYEGKTIEVIIPFPGSGRFGHLDPHDHTVS